MNEWKITRGSRKLFTKTPRIRCNFPRWSSGRNFAELLGRRKKKLWPRRWLLRGRLWIYRRSHSNYNAQGLCKLSLWPRTYLILITTCPQIDNTGNRRSSNEVQEDWTGIKAWHCWKFRSATSWWKSEIFTDVAFRKILISDGDDWYLLYRRRSATHNMVHSWGATWNWFNLDTNWSLFQFVDMT